MKTIDRNTFLLLDEYATSLWRIANILEKDPGFSTLASIQMKKVPTSYTITEYVFFEITSIFNHCIDPDKSPQNSIEGIGIIFMGLKFYNSKFITYENVLGLINGHHKEVIEYYLNYSEKVNHYIRSTNSDFPSLSFPKLLKLSNHYLTDEYATALYRFAALVVKLDNQITEYEEQALKRIWQATHLPTEGNHNSINISNPTGTENDDKETLEDIIKELDGLIGLTKVKEEVSTLVNFVKIQKERESQGLKTPQVSYHCVFTGSPGTGKTTVARIVAKIYKKLGVLTKGHLVETDRSGLIAEYTGQTAVKVDKVIQSALDGILFIDEAYSLIGENRDDFGKEAVATIIKRMEDYRNRLVIIVAGYPDEMEYFIENNPGLKSRFNRYIRFEDYTGKELVEIYKSFCSKMDYKLTKKAQSKLLKAFEGAIELKDESFGNGRLSRNIFEKSIEKQANRLSKSEKPLTKELLITIQPEDIPDGI